MALKTRLKLGVQPKHTEQKHTHKSALVQLPLYMHCHTHTYERLIHAYHISIKCCTKTANPIV